MRETRKYTVYPSNIQVLRAFKDLQAHMERCSYKEDSTLCDHVSYKVILDSFRTLETTRYGEFLDILARYPKPERIIAHSHWDTAKTGNLGCIVYLYPSEIEMVVESSDLNILAGTHDSLSRIFDASNPPDERSPRLRRHQVKRSIFLAHRFDEGGTTATNSLLRFLTRLGFNVLEGTGYQARDIPQKVAERISTQDIFICVATSGDHSWILSETAFARGLNKYIIVLCEEGLSFNKGILGNDYEYLAFPRACIEKAFSDLLYALPR